MKTKKWLICIILILAVLMFTVIQPSYAGDYEKIEDPISNPDQYKPSSNTTSNNTKFIDIGKTLIAAIQIIGSLVCVVSMMILGIRYMMGSASDKATYKETMIPYLIGAVMAFAIPTIIQVVYDLVMEIA